MKDSVKNGVKRTHKNFSGINPKNMDLFVTKEVQLKACRYDNSYSQKQKRSGLQYVKHEPIFGY